MWGHWRRRTFDWELRMRVPRGTADADADPTGVIHGWDQRKMMKMMKKKL